MLFSLFYPFFPLSPHPSLSPPPLSFLPSHPPPLHPFLLHSRPKIYGLSDGEWQLHSISNPSSFSLTALPFLRVLADLIHQQVPFPAHGEREKLTERAR